MRSDRNELKCKIHQLDFAIYELVLFLDTHPRNAKAMHLLEEYRHLRFEKIAEYERRFGEYIVTIADVKPSDCWEWLKGPWPWENKFMED